MQAEEVFDITDGKNRYEPCPACGVEWMMGRSSCEGRIFIVCGRCRHKGPQIAYDDKDVEARRLKAIDRQAFEAWNAESCMANDARRIPAKGLFMIDRIELAEKIDEFLKAHAKTAAAYNPDVDDPSERFNGPDSAMLYAAARRLKADAPFQMPFSSWGSGCYQPVHDKDARIKHDEIMAELSLLHAQITKAPGR
jgi:hypothetical protein